MVEFDARQLDTTGVSRVAGLGHVLRDLGDGTLLLAAVSVGDDQPVAVAAADCRDHAGQWDDRGRKHIALE